MKTLLLLLLLSCAHPAPPQVVSNRSCLTVPAPNGDDIAMCLMQVQTGDDMLGCLVQGINDRDAWITAAVEACGVSK